MSKRIILLFIIFSFSVFKPGYADSGQETLNELMSMDLEDILSMEVTVATRVPKAFKDVPAAISVITSDDIEGSPYVEIWDLLKTQPGVNVQVQDGSASGVAVSVRGFNWEYGSNKLAVFQDGRSLFNPLTQGTWWDAHNFFLEDIDRIEIMRGPNSVLYGFNAFSGIINVVSKELKDTTGILTKTVFGTNSQQKYFVRVGDVSGNFGYRLSYERDNSRGLGDDHGQEMADSKRINGFNLSTQYDFSDEKNIEFFAGANEGVRSDTSTAEEPESDFQTLVYNQSFEDDSSIKLQLSRTYWNVDRYSIALASVPYVSGYDHQYTQYDIDFQHNFILNENNDIVWGANFRNNYARSYLMTDPNNVYHDRILRMYAQDTVSLTDSLTYYGGLEWEQNNYTGSDWSMRHSLMYDIDEKQSVRATFARAFHAHSFLEYHFLLQVDINGPSVPGGIITTTQGNPNLERESITAYELGYRSSFFDKKMIFDFELFYNNINKIVRVLSTTPNYDNNNRAEVKGLETSIKYYPKKWIMGYANYSYLSVDDKFEYFKRVNPKHIFNLGAKIDFQSCLLDYLDIRWSYVGSIEAVTTQYSSSRRKVSDYTTLDLKAAKTFFNGDMELSLAGLNLIDDHIEYRRATSASTQATRDNIVPRQFLLGVKIIF